MLAVTVLCLGKPLGRQETSTGNLSRTAGSVCLDAEGGGQGRGGTEHGGGMWPGGGFFRLQGPGPLPPQDRLLARAQVLRPDQHMRREQTPDPPGDPGVARPPWLDRRLPGGLAPAPFWLGVRRRIQAACFCKPGHLGMVFVLFKG